MTNKGLHIAISKRSLIIGGCPSWCGKFTSVISPIDNTI